MSELQLPVGVLLKIIEKEICRRVGEYAAEFGLTYAQMHVLQFICRSDGAVCQRDLERCFDLSHATVSGLIDRLQAKDFLTVNADPEDRRRKILCATKKAHVCSDALKGYIMRSDLQLLHGFTPEETAVFRSYLNRLTKNLSIPNVDPAADV